VKAQIHDSHVLSWGSREPVSLHAYTALSTSRGDRVFTPASTYVRPSPSTTAATREEHKSWAYVD